MAEHFLSLFQLILGNNEIPVMLQLVKIQPVACKQQH